jgi:membrane-bound ClpP family serine protease
MNKWIKQMESVKIRIYLIIYSCLILTGILIRITGSNNYLSMLLLTVGIAGILATIIRNRIVRIIIGIILLLLFITFHKEIELFMNNL